MRKTLVILAGAMALALGSPLSQGQVISQAITDSPNLINATGTLDIQQGSKGTATYSGYWFYTVLVNWKDPNPPYQMPWGQVDVQHQHPAGTTQPLGPYWQFTFDMNLPVMVEDIQIGHDFDTDFFNFWFKGTDSQSGFYTKIDNTPAIKGNWEITAIHVPEPQHYALAAGLGLMAFGAYRRFRKA